MRFIFAGNMTEQTQRWPIVQPPASPKIVAIDES